MEISLYPSSPWEIIKNIHEGGLLKWYHPKVYYERETIVARKDDLLEHRRQLSNYMFSLANIWFAERPINSSRRFLQELDPKVIDDPNHTDYVLFQVNACALFGLPGVEPIKELKSIRKMLASIKTTLDWYIDQNPDNTEEARCQIFTRSKPLSVIEAIEFLWDKETQTDAVNAKMLQANADLRNMIARDENMQIWMRFMRRGLNQIGIYSWFTLAEKDFYDDFDAPSSKRFHRLRQADKLPAKSGSTRKEKLRALDI
jgi:hypothetical protein